jgi:hypothetical protein
LDRTGFSNRFFGTKLLPVCICTFILLLTMPPVSGSGVDQYHPDETGKHKILRGIAGNWIQVGLEQHQRAFFGQAEKSFLQAQLYQQYLTNAEAEKLNSLLEGTRTAVLERGQDLGHIKTADKLIGQGQPIKAKAHLEKVKGSRLLTGPEQKQVLERLKGIDNQLDSRQEAIAALYERSVALYNTAVPVVPGIPSGGRLTALEQARKGFLEVAASGLSKAPPSKTAEDYLVKIDDILRSAVLSPLLMEEESGSNLPDTGVGTVKEVVDDVVTEPVIIAQPQEVRQPNESVMVDAASPLTEQNGRIEATDRRRNILRSYARAVVEDAIAKVRNYVNEGRFYRAKQALETAEQALNKNRPHLRDSSFNRYHSQLERLAEQIVKGRALWLGDWDSKSAWKL